MKRLLTLVSLVGSMALASCEETEYQMPQTLRFEIDGGAFYATYYDANQPGGAFPLGEHELLIGEAGIAEMIVMPGDSIYLFVSDSRTPFEEEHVTITVTLDGKIIETGDTRESGYYTLSGRLGKGLFKVKK